MTENKPTIKKRELTTAALCASAIRAELKKAFPGIRFDVRSKNYSGGNSVNVSWEDGPVKSAIDEIIGKYQYGHFDGSIDLYEYSNSRDDIPQARFVFSKREMSKETEARLVRELSEKYGVDMKDEQAVFAKFDRWPANLLYRAFNGEE